MKQVITSLSIRGMQSMVRMKYHLIMVRMALVKKYKSDYAGEGVEKSIPTLLVGM